LSFWLLLLFAALVFSFLAAPFLSVVVAPGLAARVVKDQVRIVDVMPTLLELLKLQVPSSVQGTSLLPLARGERLNLQALSESWFPRFHYGWSELVAIQDERRAPRRCSGRSSGCSPRWEAPASRSRPRPWTPRRPSGCRRSATSAAR
jgi:hypothetical protein